MIGLVFALAGPAMAGPDWTEPPADAGSTPTSAQTPTGGGPLKTISGSLSSSFTAAAGADFEDVYRIRICNPQLFCAKTSANFNSQIWLFTDDGIGLLGNDDGAGQNAVIVAFANDGTQARINAPGVYLIGISGFNNDPLGMGPTPGKLAPIFQQETTTEISGPDGPGGQFPLAAWTGPGATGDYIIRLEGAAFANDSCASGNYVQSPCIPAVSEWGAAILLITLLTGGTVVLRRQPSSC
jgi:hypothetical protein